MNQRGVIALTATALAVFGVSILVFIAWEIFGTNAVSKREHARQIEAITQAWETAEVEATETDSTQPAVKGSLLRIPRFGDDWVMPVLDGFDMPTFAKGVGRYEAGAEPGEVGNLVLGGHRRSRGESFRQFPELRAGDEVIVETETHLFSYELIDSGRDFKLDFSTSWPMLPNPTPTGDTATATEPMVTLLTCAELFHSRWRAVARGVLVETVVKD